MPNLYNLDDSSFRDHRVYPKELADFARSQPKRTPEQAAGEEAKRLRCLAGQPCPQAGWWWTPAQVGSRRYLQQGEIMPSVGGDYGQTIWQWDEKQS